MANNRKPARQQQFVYGQQLHSLPLTSNTSGYDVDLSTRTPIVHLRATQRQPLPRTPQSKHTSPNRPRDGRRDGHGRTQPPARHRKDPPTASPVSDNRDRATKTTLTISDVDETEDWNECNICAVQFTTQEMYLKHCRGAAHTTRMLLKASDAGIVNKDPMIRPSIPKSIGNSTRFHDSLPTNFVFKKQLHCSVCNATCTDGQMYQLHMDGKRHRKNLRKEMAIGTEILPEPELQEGCQYEYLNTEKPARVLQQLITVASKEPLIGLECVTETIDSESDKATYKCDLCEYSCESATLLVTHLIDRKPKHNHRLNYLRSRRPKLYSDVEKYASDELVSDQLVIGRALQVEKEMGRSGVRQILRTRVALRPPRPPSKTDTLADAVGVTSVHTRLTEATLATKEAIQRNKHKPMEPSNISTRFSYVPPYSSFHRDKPQSSAHDLNRQRISGFQQQRYYSSRERAYPGSSAQKRKESAYPRDDSSSIGTVPQRHSRRNTSDDAVQRSSRAYDSRSEAQRYNDVKRPRMVSGSDNQRSSLGRDDLMDSPLVSSVLTALTTASVKNDNDVHLAMELTSRLSEAVQRYQETKKNSSQQSIEPRLMDFIAPNQLMPATASAPNFTQEDASMYSNWPPTAVGAPRSGRLGYASTQSHHFDGAAPGAVHSGSDKRSSTKEEALRRLRSGDFSVGGVCDQTAPALPISQSTTTMSHAAPTNNDNQTHAAMTRLMKAGVLNAFLGAQGASFTSSPDEMSSAYSYTNFDTAVPSNLSAISGRAQYSQERRNQQPRGSRRPDPPPFTTADGNTGRPQQTGVGRLPNRIKSPEAPEYNDTYSGHNEFQYF